MHLPCLWLVIPTATRYSTVLLIAWFIRSCTPLCLNCWTCQICSSGLQLFNLIINYQFNSDLAITILSGYCDHVNSLSVQRCPYSHLYFLYGYCDKSEQESWFAIIFVVMHSTAVLPLWLEQEDGQYGVLCKMQYGTLFIEFIQSWLSACEYWCLRVSSCVFNIYWNGSLQHVFAYAWMPILSRWSACNSHAENYTRHIGILKCDAQAFYWLKEKINKVWKSPRQKYHYYFHSFNSSRNIWQIIVAFVLYQFSQTVGNSN